MNLAPQIGMRSVYSWKEVASFLGMKEEQVRSLVRTNRLIKRYTGMFPFAQKDVNQFLVRFNAGEIQFGVRRKGKRFQEAQ